VVVVVVEVVVDDGICEVKSGVVEFWVLKADELWLVTEICVGKRELSFGEEIELLRVEVLNSSVLEVSDTEVVEVPE